MRISDWSSDVCSSDLQAAPAQRLGDEAAQGGDALLERGAGDEARGDVARELRLQALPEARVRPVVRVLVGRHLQVVAAELRAAQRAERKAEVVARSEEHTSELQSLMRSSYAVFCLKKKTINNT